MVFCVSVCDSGVVVESMSDVFGNVVFDVSSVCRCIGEVISMCGCGMVLSVL